MKTIINAVQKWTGNEIKENIKNSTADWNENDSSKDSYVKNRPFWTSDPVETIIVEETTFELVDSMTVVTSTQPLEVGQDYFITLDDITYNCVSKMDYDMNIPYIGNIALFELGEDTGEPFVIAPMDSETEFGIMISSDVLEHTISITCMIPKVNQIDEKYMPDLFHKRAGLKVEGTIYTIDDEEVVAETGAEVFNQYIYNKALGIYSHAEGEGTIASGDWSHAEGINTIASRSSSHAEGRHTTASGSCSHAECNATTASGNYSHAEGDDTTASGTGSHAEGYMSIASGEHSHAEGSNTTASSRNQHTQGIHNIEDAENKYAHIVGNGKSSSRRSNAHTLDWNGIGWYQGGLQVGGNAQDDGAKTVMANGDTEIILSSSTEGSTKQFKLTVDDSGTLTVTEIVSES